MRSTHFFEAVGSCWSYDSDQPLLPDSPLGPVPDDDDAEQRAFVEEMYCDLGVGD
jgi:hypothetical protein